MNIRLTDDEREVALKYAARLEKNAARWRFWRWSGVLGFVFGLGLLLAVDQVGRMLQSVTELPEEALNHGLKATPELNASSIELLASQIEFKAATLRAEIFLSLKALIVAAIGVGMFVYATSDWRRDRRDRLIAKLICGLASEGNEDPEENGS